MPPSSSNSDDVLPSRGMTRWQTLTWPIRIGQASISLVNSLPGLSGRLDMTRHSRYLVCRAQATRRQEARWQWIAEMRNALLVPRQVEGDPSAQSQEGASCRTRHA